MKTPPLAFLPLFLAGSLGLQAAGTTDTPFKTFLSSSFVLGNGATRETAADPARPNLRAESIQHAYAVLSNTPDYVQVTVPPSGGSYTAPVNRIIVRYSVRFSDSQNHNGSWTLSVHANSGGSYHKVGSLTLKTKYIHAVAGPENTFLPASPGTAETSLQRWWEEATAVLTEDIPSGGNVRIRMDATDLAADYYIDAIDLERAPSPTSRITTNSAAASRKSFSVRSAKTGISRSTGKARSTACASFSPPTDRSAKGGR